MKSIASSFDSSPLVDAPRGSKCAGDPPSRLFCPAPPLGTGTGLSALQASPFFVLGTANSATVAATVDDGEYLDAFADKGVLELDDAFSFPAREVSSRETKGNERRFLCRTSSFKPTSLLLHPLGLKRGSEVTLGLFDLRGGEVTLGLDERDKLWLTYDKS